MAVKRDPSLHITKVALIEILNTCNLGRLMGHKLAEEIFSKAEPYQIKNRYLAVMNLKSDTKKKVSRSMKSDTGVPEHLVEKFNMILTSYRQKKNANIKLRPILKDSKDYLMLKEVAKIAHDFSEHFDITPVEDGYLEFVEIGYSMMRKYAINRFKYYEQKIYEHFEDKVTVITDKNREATLEFYAIWQQKMIDYSGLNELIDVDNNYSKFVHFVYGRQEADALNVDYDFWITAQFEGLVFLDAVPELSQFYGEGAKTRYERYLRKSIEFEENTENSITDYYDGD